MDMKNDYANAQIRAATARNLAQLGFTQTSQSCFDAMSDVTRLYLEKFTSRVVDYMEQRVQPTPGLADVERALDRMKVSRREVYDYLKQVRSTEPVQPVPWFPATRVLPTSVNEAQDNRRSDFAAQEDVNSTKGEEMQPLEAFPNFAEVTAYSAGLVKAPRPQPSPQPEPPNVEVPLTSTVALNEPEVQKEPLQTIPTDIKGVQRKNQPKSGVNVSSTARHTSHSAEALHSKKYLEVKKGNAPVHSAEPAHVRRKKTECHVSLPPPQKVQDEQISSPKKQVKVEPPQAIQRSTTDENVPKKQSAKIAEWTKKLGEEQRHFEQVLKEKNAVFEQYFSLTNTNATGCKQDERRVPPLRLKVIRSRSGTNIYRIIRPKFVIHHKRSLVLKCKNIYTSRSARKVVENHGAHKDESGVLENAPTVAAAARKQEALKSKKPTSMPYLASDLARNSYPVLTACITGRAFPDLSSAALKNAPNPSQTDLSAKQRVHEVIWQQLYSKTGIVGERQNKEVQSEPDLITVTNSADVPLPVPSN